MNPETLAAEQSGDVSVQDTSMQESVALEQENRADIEPHKTTVKDAFESETTDDNDGDGIGETVGFGIKVAAVALSVVFLLISILAVTLPFSAMKIYNQLGMYDRALESGERFINSRMNAYDGWAEKVDGVNGGYFTSIGKLSADEDFIEALEVCISLSDKLMRAQLAKKSVSGAAYYAEKLEKFTHAFACLPSGVFVSKSTENIGNVPYIQLRPYVYNYRHTIMKLNYSARVVLGSTDNMLYNIGYTERVITSMTERLNTFSGTVQKETLLDQYVDFIGELNAYLDYELGLLGLSGVSFDETTVGTKYSKVLDGTQFGLLIKSYSGFTDLYNRLSATFTEYAQLAYDYKPSSMDDRLHQLYWLLELTTFSEKMSGVSMLLYYNVYAYLGSGVNEAIRDSYPEWDEKRAVYNGVQKQVLIELYNNLLKQYVSIFQS